MSTENVLALFEGGQGSEEPIAQGDQGTAWVAQVTGDQAAPAPPPPMPEAADATTPPPPPAMPEPEAPAPPSGATTMAVPAEKSAGGWEVDAYRLRAFGDAVVRARAYLDAVRMKVDRMQGPEMSPQLGTSPVGQQLAKKFDDRLNADYGLRAMLTEAMKRMERFVATAEEASRAYEQAEQDAVENLEKFKFEVEWADEPWWEEDSKYDGHDHGKGEPQDQDPGAEPADDETEDPAEDRTEAPEEDQADVPAEDQDQDHSQGQDRGEDQNDSQGQDSQGQDHGQDQSLGQDQGQDQGQGADHDQDHDQDRGEGEEPGQPRDEQPAGNGHGAPG